MHSRKQGSLLKSSSSNSEQEYSVVVHVAEEGGYWVEVPALPGCYSQGETVDDALEQVRAAIEGYLEALRDEGGFPPRDEDVVFKVAVAL
jgi:predicted RNase H-like HicB family nuclease